MSAGHVLIMLENEPYPCDRRVRQTAEALVGDGWAVTVGSPTGQGYEALEEEIDGVRALRFALPLEGTGPLAYVREYGRALRELHRVCTRLVAERPVDVVLTCSPPDFLHLAARPALRRGAGLVFDHHDLSPELYEAKFGRRDALHRLLVLAERRVMRRADVVLSTTDSYARIARERGGADPAKVHVVRNGPDPARIFPVEPDPALRGGKKHLVLWIGVMNEQENLGLLLDVAEELVLRRGRDDVLFALVGPGAAREPLAADARARGLGESVVLPGPVGDDGVRAWTSTADICVSVDEPNAMNDASVMTKVVESMTLGRAIVQTPLREMRALCGDTTAYASTAHEFADTIAALLDDPSRRAALGAAARARAVPALTWPQQVPALLAAVRALRPPAREAAVNGR